MYKSVTDNGKITIKEERRFLFYSLLISTSFTFLILNRWIVTELREKSFGRMWMYFVSWFDFGFHRRGLIGTILTETGINTLLDNPYIFSYIFYGLLITIIYTLVTIVIIHNEQIYTNKWHIFTIVFSPALFSHLAYSTGNNDIFLIILFLVGTFFTSNPYTLSIISACGILTHESFIFYLPCLFLLKLIEQKKDQGINFGLLMPILVALMVILVIVYFGRIDTNILQYEHTMANRLKIGAYEHPFWSGYFELTTTAKDNMNYGRGVFSELWVDRWYLFGPTIYAIFIAITVFYSSCSSLIRLILFISILFPISIQIVAYDYYRWVCISATLGLFSITFMVTKNKVAIPTWFFIALAPFSLLSPFGSATANRPFPMHQLIIERLL